MKTKIAITALVLAGAAAAFLYTRQKANGKDQMRTVTAESGPIMEAVEATGSVEPMNRVEVRSPIAGRIDQLLAEEGDKVAAGRIVAWMSSSDRVAVLDAAKAKGKEEHLRWLDAYKPTPIVAPISGDVILRNVVVGEQVAASAIIYAVSDRLIVSASVDESDIGRVKVGMPAEITLDSYPDKTAVGKVFRILFEGKNVSNVITYMVKISPNRIPPYFRSQMTANIKLVIRRKPDAVLLLSNAVREGRGGDKTVLAPGPDGKPARLPVEVGIESGEMTEIVSGLKPGDQVYLQSKRYTPQSGPMSSLLSFGRRPGGGAPGQQPGRPGQTQQGAGAQRSRRSAAPGD
ncbi:MAG: HlyD family efflux transporter periplasmic adaptor subunit [Elusimicrobia bacterium]|nr:HlyD family efflux transporter periplasmic adaptor subunit [Elusimicrobiota bacterium]